MKHIDWHVQLFEIAELDGLIEIDADDGGTIASMNGRREAQCIRQGGVFV